MNDIRPENSRVTTAFRMPVATDGPAISGLIAACPPLDCNSAYCNLLQCTHFAQTSIIAERGGEVVGWVSGYHPPAADAELFVWQVAVAPSMRGTGLGSQMLDGLVARPGARVVSMLTTTITDENASSWALFGSFARRHHAPIARRPMFDRNIHFAGLHETEHLVSIGPLNVKPKAKEVT